MPTLRQIGIAIGIGVLTLLIMIVALPYFG